MRYRWDPAYPMGRRDTAATDATLRASDNERNAVADKLARHYAEGRLDETEFKSAWTPPCRPPRGATSRAVRRPPRLPSPPPPPPPRHRRVLPWVFLVVFFAIVAGATLPFYPLYHVPWLLVAIVGFVLWRRAVGGHRHHHHRGDRTTATAVWVGPTRSWTTEPCATPLPLPADTDRVTAPRALRSMELFAGLPEDELEEMAALCDISTAHPGQVVQAQDVPVRLWHVVSSGHAVVQRDGTPIGLLGRGDSWSEHSLLNGLRSSIAVVALSPLTLFTLSLRQFFAVPEHHPVLAGRLVARSATSADRLALPVYNALVHLGLAGGG